MSSLGKLKKNYEFQEVYQSGQRLFSRSFVLFYLPSTDPSFGVVASGKTFGKAVNRNRAKRRMREIVRAAAKSGGLLSGKIVLVGRQHILKVDFAELKMELQECLKKLSLG